MLISNKAFSDLNIIRLIINSTENKGLLQNLGVNKLHYNDYKKTYRRQTERDNEFKIRFNDNFNSHLFLLESSP